ncbi:MAG: tetratricopeptide repeat protein [Planctomycetes bacterium]|nr:tetratricopeptide repeat protein [Planctomycetota bacterium]
MAKSRFTLLLPLTTLALAAFVLMTRPLDKAEDLLIQRRYAAAVTELQKLLKEGVPAGERDRALILLGRAQQLANDLPGAIATYQTLIDRMGDSPLVHKARFRRAETMAAAGDFRGAAPIYQGEIERLVGLERKEELATTYLGLAERALAGEKPDRKRAVTFFDLAIDLGLSPEKQRAVALQAAEARLAQPDFADAVRRFTPLAASLQRGQGKLRAMLGLGRALWRAGQAAKARSVLRDLIATAPDDPLAGDAAFEIALTLGVPGPAFNQVERAIAALQRVHDRFPAHPKAKVAPFLIACCYRHAGRSEDALRAVRSFLDGDHADLAELPLARAMVGDILNGQGKREEAIAAWRAFLKAHPSHRDWERVQRAIVDAEYAMALADFQRGPEGFAAARQRFAAFARDYPIDPRNPQVLWFVGEMLFQERKYDEAREAFARCVSKYPGSDPASAAQFRIGEIFETKTFNYQAALDAYRKVTWGRSAATAQQRIQLLTRKHLELLTPRTFRTGEKARFRLTSRNIEKVRVRVFRLDMETYFRSTHLTGDVDGLDIEVIEPDRTFDSAVPEYVKHKETERDVEIGLGDAGAYVVKVDDRELEATTMVLVTDVALIAKCSRHECFVFTQNLKENRTESGVKVVLSDGKKIVAEGTTGNDGVWRYKGPELQRSDRLSVFAVDAAGSGASSLDLSGMGYSQGLTAKAYLYTDQPIYRPGQRVHVRGIVREVEGGLYRLPRGEDYRVQVLSANGRLLLQRKVRFSSFGTFTADLSLPPEAELGTWTVRVDDGPRSGQSTTATFEVAQYQRPRLELTAEPKARVVLRGEKVEGLFRLRYYFGEPAAGKTVTYSLRLPDGGLVERSGVSTASGEVAFSFDTREFNEESVAQIRARVAEANVATTLLVPIVTTTITPSVSVMRSVYLTGESFEVTVKVVDRTGKPVVQRGTVELLRRERGLRGATQEVRTAELPFSTAADGTARVPFRAEQGGDYVVRVRTQDRLGTPVSAQTGVAISGKNDQIKLRLLSDRQYFKVGETVRLKVANRAGPRLALRTAQGDGVLAYQSLVLPVGESTLDVVLQPMHAPNFTLALAMIDGQQLHTAERELRVSRDLQITVKPTQPRVEPGSEVEVEISTRDATGKPVAAELALGVVDDALLALRADHSPAIGAFFFGSLRETALRTVSSCTWQYRGRARRMSAELLAEERRLDEERKESTGTGAGGGDDFYLGTTRRQVHGRRPGNEPNLAPKPRGSLSDAKDKQDGRRLGQRQRAGEDQQASRESAFDAGIWSAARGLHDIPDLHRKPDTDHPTFETSNTGVWVPTVVTGEDGTARVKLRLPRSTTSYSLIARAVTIDTSVGEGRGTMRAAKDLQVGAVLPFVMTEGDRADATASVHNLTTTGRTVDVNVTTAQGEHRNSKRTPVEVAAQGESGQSFEVAANGNRDLEVTVSARSGPLTDSLTETVRVLPYGVEYRDGRSGHTTSGETLTLGLPAGREYTRIGMQIQVGRDPGRDLVRAALGDGYRPDTCRRVDTTNLGLTSRGIACLLVLDHLEQVHRATPADIARLRGVAASVLSRLVASQNKDGGLGWVGRRSTDLRATAQLVQFLTLARKRGLEAAHAPLDRGGEWLLRHIRRATAADRARSAWALVSAGGNRIDYGMLNALHRGRSSLDATSLCHLALAWQDFGRKELASEVLRVLRPKLTLTGAKHATDIETVGLAATALLRDDPRDADGVRAIEWLVNHRTGVSWSTPTATAAAVRALCTAGGRESPAGSNAEVRIEVNGKVLATVPATVKDESSRFSVPAEWLTDRDNRVRIAVNGRGNVHYSALLSGFTKEFKSLDNARGIGTPNRIYLPAPRRHNGKVLSAGFGVVQGSFHTFTNQITRLSVGESGRVHLSLWIDPKHRDEVLPLVVEESIPAGCTVPRDSISGDYEHVVAEPGKLTFYFRERAHSASITYTLHGRIPGTYRVLPTRAYGALRPDLLSHGKPASFRVLPRGSDDRDAYRYTPDELYQLGKMLFDEGALEQAGKHLGTLLHDWHQSAHQLRGSIYKDVARMMLFISVARHDSKSTVRFFEDLKEQFPDLVIPFDKIVAVGKAYRDIGEFEQAVMVFRAAAESSFLKEAAVANTLEQLGEVRASMRFLRQLLLGYPDLNTMRVSLYSVGQKLAALAARMPDGAPVDPRVGKRDALRKAALATFREFLIHYPEDSTAEEVSFAWATTCIEGKDLATAHAIAAAALERYPQSSLSDELLYTVGFTQYARGDHAAAFATLQRVAEGEFPLPDGGRGPSQNRFHAIYLQGQIHHARGEPDKALQAYKQVEQRFSDAAEASDYFLRKDLVLPEISTFAPGKPVEVELGYRNIEEVEVTVYRVDLMRLYILHKSLNNIRGIQLHGIRPFAEIRAKLGEGRDYKSKTKKLSLPLDKPGAYLVVARGADLLATGMALCSELRIEAQEFLDVGRVRVNVKDHSGCVADAHVKVVGSGDLRFQSGESDLRGIFIGSGLIGEATVIVKKGDQYAFFRGKGIHQPAHHRPPQVRYKQVPGQTKKVFDPSKAFNAWNNNLECNDSNRSRQVDWLQRKVLKVQQKGVEVYRTK